MRTCLFLLVAGALHAATVRGTVVENQTGHPLAHASVTLEPIPGSGGTRMSAKTNRYGSFEFAGAAPGIYILQATRVPFFTAYYGQKRWNSAGAPLTVTESETPSVTIHMMRFGAIAGHVVDENDVGQPQFEVAAYRNTTPLQLITNAKADERGAFRIYGLLPGTYLVRSVGKQFDGVGYKPTFAHETESANQARILDVEMEQEAPDVKLRALPGQLFSLTVGATAEDPPGVPVTLTLVSEMTRQVVQASSHTFTGLPRGDYEIFAEAPTETPGQKQGAYQRISIGKDFGIGLNLRRIQGVRFDFEGLPPKMVDDGTVRLLGRRKDLAGYHDQQVIKLTNRYAVLAPGPWELAVAPVDGYYVSGFSGLGPYRTNKRVDGWNEVSFTYGGSVRFSFSSSPGTLHGTVSDTGDPVVGAPVFLEPTDLEPARRITDTYVALTDIHGRYHFGGLPPAIIGCSAPSNTRCPIPGSWKPRAPKSYRLTRTTTSRRTWTCT